MKTFLHLVFAVAMFAAAIASESYSSDLLRVDQDGWYAWQVAGDEPLEIYARVESGRPVEMRIPTFECVRGRRLPDDVRDLGVVSAGESIAWLRRFVEPHSDLSPDVLFIIAAHDDDAAFRFLDELLTAPN